jgi:ATP-dependent Zn protease
MRHSQLHIQRARVVDQEVALRVDHLAPRGRNLERANASVGARLSDVLLTREDLQKPEPEEEDREER